MNNEYVDTVQMRIGRILLEKIDQAADQISASRNYWVVKQARWLLVHPPLPFSITASAIMADKQMIMIRMPKKLTKKVDRECKRLGLTRTLWMMDACMSGLRNDQIAKKRARVRKARG